MCSRGTVPAKVTQPVSKRILFIDDDPDITLTFKGGGGIESNNGNDSNNKELKYIHITIQYALILMNPIFHSDNGKKDSRIQNMIM